MTRSAAANVRWAGLVAVPALALSIVGCSFQGASASCPDGLVTWMGSADTYDMDPVPSSTSVDVEAFVPSDVEPTCRFAGAENGRSAIALLPQDADAGERHMDEIRDHLLNIPTLTQATDGENAFVFTADDGTLVSVELKPAQFLADIGSPDAGTSVVIVRTARLGE
jgi:hypothetical protein